MKRPGWPPEAEATTMFRVILHLDMDAFYASVEQRDHQALQGQPVIVGAPPTQRGVVCAASYEARKFGVRSAMPSMTAGRLCPAGVFIRPRMEACQAESREIMAMVRRLASGQIEPVSIDEAYVDVSARCPGADPDASLQLAVPLARQIKDAVRAERHLTATIGVAPNKLLAKLASDYQKPDGLTVILESQKVQFLRPLPVRALHGVGKVTEENLARAVIRTVGDFRMIYRLGCWLLAREKLVNRPLRLLGLGVSGLVEVRTAQLKLPLNR